MATVKRRSTVPYYAAAGTWVIYALLFPLYRVPQFIFIAIVSAVVYFIMNAVCGGWPVSGSKLCGEFCRLFAGCVQVVGCYG